MGYTVYWKVAPIIEIETFQSIRREFEQAVELLPVELRGGDGEGTPKITDDIIQFNGDASEGGAFETFTFNRKVRDKVLEDDLYKVKNKYFHFCKTIEKPYTLAVKVLLLIAKKHLGDDIELDLDGPDTDWEDAVEILNQLYGDSNEAPN